MFNWIKNYMRSNVYVPATSQLEEPKVEEPPVVWEDRYINVGKVTVTYTFTEGRQLVKNYFGKAIYYGMGGLGTEYILHPTVVQSVVQLDGSACHWNKYADNTMIWSNDLKSGYARAHLINVETYVQPHWVKLHLPDWFIAENARVYQLHEVPPS